MKNFLNEWNKFLSEQNEEVRYHVMNKRTTNFGPVMAFDTMRSDKGPLSFNEIKDLIDFGLVGKSSKIKKVVNGKQDSDWVSASEVEELQEALDNSFYAKRKSNNQPVSSFEELYVKMSDILNTFTKMMLEKKLNKKFDPNLQYWRYFKGDNLQNMGILFPKDLYDLMREEHNSKLLTSVGNDFMGADHFDAVDRGKKVWSAHHLGKEYLVINPQEDTGSEEMSVPRPLSKVHPRDLIYYPYYKS